MSVSHLPYNFTSALCSCIKGNTAETERVKFTPCKVHSPVNLINSSQCSFSGVNSPALDAVQLLSNPKSLRSLE